MLGTTVASFRIWGKIEDLGAAGFFVIASAVPDPPTERAIVRTAIAPTIDIADTERGRLMVEVGAAARDRGGIVVDVED